MTSQIDPTVPVYGNPTTASVRTNFGYAKNEITALQNVTAQAPYVPISGATMTGALVLAADPSAAGEAATKSYVDSKAAVPGPPGPTGPTGPAGATGPAGPGVAAGGTTGQVLTKSSATDYATNWTTPNSGGGTVTSISAGTGITLSPSPITATGSVALTVPVSVANGGTGSTTAAGAPFVEVAGDTMTGGLSFGSTYAANTDDESRHIQLYGTNYGFNVTAARLNYVAPSHYFRANATDVVRIDQAGGLNVLAGGMTVSGAATFNNTVYGPASNWTGTLTVTGGGLVLGAPTGGNLGAGTINAAGGIVSATGLACGTTSFAAFTNSNALSHAPGNGLLVETATANAPLTLNRTAGNGSIVIFYQTSSLSPGSIVVNNGTSTAYNTTSDGRLKEDLRPFDPGPILDRIEVHDFRWKAREGVKSTRAYGVIAQDVAEIYPLAFTHDESSDSWMVDYSKFVPLLLAETRALRSRVAELTARLEAVEAKLA